MIVGTGEGTLEGDCTSEVTEINSTVEEIIQNMRETSETMTLEV